MKTILLTGSTGFIGYQLLRLLLLKNKYNIILLIRRTEQLTGHEKLIERAKKDGYYEDIIEKLNNIKIYEGDLSYPNFALEENIYNNLKLQIDTIIHLADISHIRSINKLTECQNIYIAKNIHKFCKNKKLIYFSNHNPNKIKRKIETLFLKNNNTHIIKIPWILATNTNGYFLKKNPYHDMIINSIKLGYYPVEINDYNINILSSNNITNYLVENIDIITDKIVFIKSDIDITWKDFFLKKIKNLRYNIKPINYTTWYYKYNLLVRSNIFQYNFINQFKYKYPLKSKIVNEDIIVISKMIYYMEYNNVIQSPPANISWLSFIIFIIMCSIFYIGGIFLLLSLYFRKTYLIILIVLLLIISLPKIILYSYSFVRNTAFELINYFSHRIIFDDNPIKYKFNNKNYIWSWCPHGVIPIGTFFGLFSDKFNKYADSNNIIPLVSWGAKGPFVKQIMDIFGCGNCNKTEIKKYIACNKSIGLWIGGISELMRTNEEKEIIYIKKRKGIFKIALEEGINIIPTFTFGQSLMYKQSMKMKIPFINSYFCLYFGKYFTTIPFMVPILNIIGKPIKVNKINNPSDNDINILREKYIIEIKKLYESYKITYNMQNRILEIQ